MFQKLFPNHSDKKLVALLLPVLIFVLFTSTCFSHGEHDPFEDLGDDPVVIEEVSESGVSATLSHRKWPSIRRQYMVLTPDLETENFQDNYRSELYLLSDSDQATSEKIILRWDNHHDRLLAELRPLFQDNVMYSMKFFLYGDGVSHVFLYEGLSAAENTVSETVKGTNDQKKSGNQITFIFLIVMIGLLVLGYRFLIK